MAEETQGLAGPCIIRTQESQSKVSNVTFNEIQRTKYTEIYQIHDNYIIVNQTKTIIKNEWL